MVLFLNVKIFVIDGVRWCLDLDVSTRFKVNVFAFRQFKNQFFNERRNVIVGAHGAFPLFGFEGLFRDLYFHVLFNRDLARKTTAFARHFFIDVTFFSFQQVSAACSDFHQALRTGPAATASR